ncbi:MAG: response regulator [Anaerolineae bacterium]
MQGHRILIVDDDPSWQELLNESLQEAGLGPHTLRVAGSLAEAEALLDRQHFHLAFVDLRLREESRELEGKQIVRKIVAQDEGTSVVIVTGHADVETALTALKEWKVLDFVLKDTWDAQKVMAVARMGIPVARERYRTRYESAAEFLRGAEGLMPWLARVLACIAPEAKAARPDRRLGDLLNALLADLYPLLRARDAPEVALDYATGTAAGRFWSKALGLPVLVRFGKAEAIAHSVAAAWQGFADVERRVADAELDVAGIVCVPRVPAFEEFMS